VSWPSHPDDEWVEVTAYGASEPAYVLAASGVAKAIARARAEFLAGSIEVEELELRIDAALAEAEAA
jgi:hypothetical protein